MLAANITSDPSDGNTYSWDIRNELSGENSSATIQYDAFGRRENLPTGFVGSGGGAGIPAVSLYDGGSTIQNIGTGTVSYLREPESGQMLMESWNGTDNIPLLDASGSTVAMVDAATGNITTSYTYDPLGSAAVTGTGSAGSGLT